MILFHGSRQGAEQIATHARRPETVALHGTGHLSEGRRDIEARLRSNTVRALMATSALEVAIDMPGLNHGINPGLPATRQQFHRRFGASPSHPTGRLPSA